MHRDGKYIFVTGEEFRAGRLSDVALFSKVKDDEVVPVGIPATLEGIRVPLERIGATAANHIVHAAELRRDVAANRPKIEALDQEIKMLFDMMAQMNELAAGSVNTGDTLASEAQRYLHTGTL